MLKSKTSKILVGVAIALIVVALIGKKAGWFGKNKLVEVTVEKAQKRTIVETVSASGKIQPEIEVKISPDVSGEVVELFVKEGQEVKKGDLLCKIKPDLYEAAVSRSDAALSTTKANMANSKARLTQSKSQLVNVEAVYQRNEKLFKENAISQADMDASKASYETAKAEVIAAEQTLKAAEFNINSAQATVKEASDNLARTSIYSPVNGIVSKLNVEKGERVVGTSQMAGTEMMRIANLNDMEVNIDVNENDIVRLSLSDTADIQVDAYIDRKFKGVVTEIANSANTSGLNVDQVTNFSVKIRILSDSYSDLTKGQPANYSPFRPGMSATVDVKTNVVYNAVSVPIQAVTTREDEVAKAAEEDAKKSKDNAKESSDEEYEDAGKEKRIGSVKEYVFVHSAGKVKMKLVTTGIQDNNNIQIISGLQTGEEVVSGPYATIAKLLKNDTEVEVVDKEELFKRRTEKE